MIDIQKVETFLAAAENLSLSEAAKHLHLSQPAVSHHIKVLEQDSLMNDLKEFGLQPELIDIRIIYRALRNLEAEGLISDSWDEISLGPQRRVYTITPQGKAALTE